MAYTELPHQHMVRRSQGYPSLDRKERISLSRDPFVVWSPLVVRSGGSASTKLFETIPVAPNIPLFYVFFSLDKNRGKRRPRGMKTTWSLLSPERILQCLRSLMALLLRSSISLHLILPRCTANQRDNQCHPTILSREAWWSRSSWARPVWFSFDVRQRSPAICFSSQGLLFGSNGCWFL